MTLKYLNLDSLRSHPKNPRLYIRENVVESIKAQIEDEGFKDMHAIIVREVNGYHQIISGHTRVEAVKRAGLKEIPAWVTDYSDDEAFMQLMLSNSQGELSPLEIGIHALEAVPKGKGGKGKVGGISEYARLVGQQQPQVSTYIKAAKVAVAVNPYINIWVLTNRALHLAQIHKVRRDLWEHFVNKLVTEEWSVQETKNHVDYALKLEAPQKWQEIFLDYYDLVTVGNVSPTDVEKLVKQADLTESLIDSYEGIEHAAYKQEYHLWLKKGSRGGYSWKLKKLREKTRELQEELQAAEYDFESKFRLICANVADLAKGEDPLIQPGSIDAIITDPPYPEKYLPAYEELAKTASKLLKDGGSLFVMSGQTYLPQVIEALKKHLSYHWTLAYLTPGGQAVQQWERKVNTFWKPILWFVKGEYKGDWLGDVSRSEVNDNDKRFHQWGQSESGMLDLVDRASEPEDLILDPFVGGGAIGTAALMLDRRFVGSDTDESALETTRKRALELLEGREEAKDD